MPRQITSLLTRSSNLFPYVLLLVLVIGTACRERNVVVSPSQTSLDASEKETSTSAPPVTQPLALTSEQITRLFATTWEADDEATLSSPLNKTADQQALKDHSWLHCIQLKTSMFFKDAGLAIKTTAQEYLIELPVKSPEFAQRIRFINDNQITFFDGKYWLIFRSR